MMSNSNIDMTGSGSDETLTHSEMPTVSAAVCTRNRTGMLRRALSALTKQSRRPIEIIVVDNAPDSDESLRMIDAEFPCVRYHREDAPGLDFARNRALREAVGDIVAYLDDDVVVAPNWIDAIAVAFTDDPDAAICTGRVEALSLDTAGQRLFEDNGGFSCGDDVIRLPNDPNVPPKVFRRPLIARSIRVGAGCSLAIRRQVALALGGFDVALDMGKPLPGGGDHDMIWRALLDNRSVVYEPTIYARHEHRDSVAAAIKQIAGHNGATVAMLTKAAAITPGRRRMTVLAFLGWRLLKPATRLLRRAVGRDPLPFSAILRVWAESWKGLVAYPLARRRVRRIAAGGIR
jgi:glycosyltransferase involved in cell wall biosynthesis